MEVGKHTYGVENIKVLWKQYGELRIGKFCSLADNITVFPAGNHAMEWISMFPFWAKRNGVFNKILPQDNRWNNKRNFDVIIGNDVWIAGGVTIMGGVKIGDGAVVARNSHVVRNVKPYSVVGGNPAQLLYYRFNKETINKLLELRWWSFPDEVVNEISPFLCSSDIEGLLNACKKYKHE